MLNKFRRIPRTQVRGIFLRDREKYDPKKAEEEMLLQYIRNYMDIDPKKLGDEAREQMLLKAKEMV